MKIATGIVPVNKLNRDRNLQLSKALHLFWYDTHMQQHVNCGLDILKTAKWFIADLNLCDLIFFLV